MKLNPGTLTNILTVGTSDRRDRWALSNYGSQIDVIAPGIDVAFLYLDGSVTTGSGSSASGPLVTGTVSLLAALRPDLNQQTAAILIGAGADDQLGDPLDTPGFDIHYGWGRVNVYNSLILARSTIDQTRLTEDGSVHLEWRCPPNASQRQPYVVETASGIEGPWEAVDNYPITYNGEEAAWTAPGEPDGLPRFYRLKVVLR